MNGFNVNDAIYFLELHAHAESHRVCAKHVRQALEAGGLDTTGHPINACEYINWLPANGWTKLGILRSERACTEFLKTGLRPGDIAVYHKPGAPTQPGHICMWTGYRWISDFKQRGINVYNEFPGAIYVYRYGGELIKHPFVHGTM